MSAEIKADYIPGGSLDQYVKNAASETWYPTGQVFEDWDDSARGATDYAVAMDGDDGGHFVGDFDTNIPAGHYYITTKIRAGASAADGDSTFGSGEIWWDGSAEQTQAEYELAAYGPNTVVPNTVVPDAAGVAAGLHSTTDGLINGLNDITVAEIIAGVADGSYDLQEMMRGIFSACCIKSAGGGTTTLTFRDSANTKNRITATVDANGNRDAVVLDLA